jgi:hypothetical protein
VIALELGHTVLHHVADRHDADERAALDHRHVAEAPRRHALHEVGDGLVLAAGHDLARHDAAYLARERALTMRGERRDDVALRQNADDAALSPRDHERADPVLRHRLRGVFQRGVGRDRHAVATLERENGTDSHWSPPCALSPREL